MEEVAKNEGRELKNVTIIILIHYEAADHHSFPIIACLNSVSVILSYLSFNTKLDFGPFFLSLNVSLMTVQIGLKLQNVWLKRTAENLCKKYDVPYDGPGHKRYTNG